MKTTYLELKTQLEEVVRTLESLELDVDSATEAYERGVSLVKQLQKYLSEAENRLKVINKSAK